VDDGRIRPERRNGGEAVEINCFFSHGGVVIASAVGIRNSDSNPVRV
jgi:hypothetical protein